LFIYAKDLLVEANDERGGKKLVDSADREGRIGKDV
jgi:hypothetical protein